MKETPTRLPLRLAPQSGESLAGFVMRLATRNLFSSPSWIADVADVAFPGLQTHNCDLRNLSVITDIDEKTLRGMASWRETDDMVHFPGGLLVPHRLFPLESRRFCPLCMKESPYHRAIWDVKPLDVCPLHGVKLESACRCGRPVTWQDQAVDRCECGSLLSQRPTQNVGDKVSTLCAQIWRLADIVPGPLSMPRSFWDGPLNQTLEVLASVGTFVVGEANASSKAQLELAAEGLALLRDWPRSYNALICSRLHQATIIKPFVRELLGVEVSPFAHALLLQYREIVGALPLEMRLEARLPLPRLTELACDDQPARIERRFHKCNYPLNSGGDPANSGHLSFLSSPLPRSQVNGNPDH